MRTLLVLVLALLLPLASEAQWNVRSEFQLQLSEGVFDKVIGDFWGKLQGQRNLSFGNTSIDYQGIPIQIQGINANLNLDFQTPQRVPGKVREWDIKSNNIAAQITVDKISAQSVVTKVVNGIIIYVTVNAECHNIVLTLPAGTASVEAQVAAELKNNQINLTLPNYKANWNSGAWTVSGMQCTGVSGLTQVISNQALQFLSTFQNLDNLVHPFLIDQFAKWSKDISLLLLSETQLPTTGDYSKIFYEPREAYENDNGVVMKGYLRIEYPYVAQGQLIFNEYQLKDGSVDAIANPNGPALIVPVDTLRSLMMGEYYSNKLTYSVRSSDIQAFQDLMGSFWKKLFGWPDLFNFAKNTPFLFQFVPMGPPSFDHESSSNNNSISGNLFLPLSVRMFAPVNGVYQPYVEFQTNMSGATTLQLDSSTNAVNTTFVSDANIDIKYRFASTWKKQHSTNEYIAISSISKAINTSLVQGFNFNIPELKVGGSILLKPQTWKIVNGNLQLNLAVEAAQ